MGKSRPGIESVPSQPQTYDCPFLGHAISGVAARQCNYSNLDDYTCRHTGESCVAKEGLEKFAQLPSEPVPLRGFSSDDFLRMKEKLDKKKRQNNYKEIAHLADHVPLE